MQSLLFPLSSRGSAGNFCISNSHEYFRNLLSHLHENQKASTDFPCLLVNFSSAEDKKHMLDSPTSGNYLSVSVNAGSLISGAYLCGVHLSNLAKFYKMYIKETTIIDSTWTNMTLRLNCGLSVLPAFLNISMLCVYKMGYMFHHKLKTLKRSE